jgi:hypothetical protein
MASRKNSTTADRRARIEAMRKAEMARERRSRMITIGVSAVVVTGLLGFGFYVISNQNEKEEKEAAALKKPITGEKTWDPKKLGRNHVEKAVSYEQKPPVGGDHSATWMSCDRNVYKEPIPNENAVHSLEHGAVWVTYTDSADKAEIKKLEERVKKTPYSMISPYKDQAGGIMLTAWGKQLTVEKADDPRVGTFFTKYAAGPQTPEPGATCNSNLVGK